MKDFEDLCNRLHTIPACDEQTDGQTSCHGIVRAMHTRRAVKTAVTLSFGVRPKSQTELRAETKV